MEMKPICKDDSSAIYSIPEDLIFEILLRLAVKSLLKFKSVSKSWCYLISGKPFIQSHLEFLTNKSDCLYHSSIASVQVMIGPRSRYESHLEFLMYKSNFPDRSSIASNPRLLGYGRKHYRYSRRLKLYPLNPLLDKPCNAVAHEIDYPMDILGTPKTTFCCNGLWCVVHLECFVLWNPATRVYRVLEHDYGRLLLQVGFGCVGGDYKILASYLVRGESIVRLYSLRAESWKDVSDFIPLDGPQERPQEGKFANRKLYWLTGTSNIIYFDLDIESSGTVDPPKDENYSNSRLELEVVGECLSLSSLRGASADVWILKQHDQLKGECWNKILNIDHESACPSMWESKLPAPLWITGEGKILIRCHQNGGNGIALIIYDPESKSFKKSCCEGSSTWSTFGWSSRPRVYVPSLVSPFPLLMHD